MTGVLGWKTRKESTAVHVKSENNENGKHDVHAKRYRII